MYKKLYIIGNGFDLHHLLETRYQAFGSFLQDNYDELYTFLTTYYSFPDLDFSKKQSFSDPIWGNFEEMLAELDFNTVLDDNSNLLANPASEDFRDRDWHSLQIEMEGVVENLTTKLMFAFKDFILKVSFPIEVDRRLIKLDSCALFLTFNYTNTLERYYNINSNQIIYIHNRALDEESQLILGHGISPDNFIDYNLTPPDNLDEESLERWREDMADNYEYSYESGKEAIMEYFAKSFKPTAQVILSHTSFFENISAVENVIVLGHSLSRVDHPYLKRIVESVMPGTKWHISYYWPEEIDRHKENLIMLGLSENQLNFFKLTEIQTYNR